MFEKFKEGNLVTLKLVSGEEVIAKFKALTSDYISIDKALVLMNGPKGLAFGTFFATAEQTEPINISTNKITSIANVNDKIKTEYERIFSTVKIPDKPKIIV
tara:strand:- start:123 stop:428 length:306 start_codon:yes stop_codon:yes gene_type:complete